ncbi:MAG: polyamine aminopropyltransferase [Candidatus Competibacterales bacterium]
MAVSLPRLETKPHHRQRFALIYGVFIAGLCSIVYELLIATTAVYLRGDSVVWFSLTIGLYMAAMGIGAFLSKYITGRLLAVFIGAEILLGFLGGLSVPALYGAFLFEGAFDAYYGFFTLTIGVLIGLEIPLLTRLLQRYDELRVNLAHILSLDYLGALVATLAFPFVLLPWLGTFRTGLLFGLVNLSMAGLVLWTFRHRFAPERRHYALGLLGGATVALAGLLLAAEGLLGLWHLQAYGDRVLYSQRSAHQEIVLTRQRDDLRLYLDGDLQFAKSDEHRYHEALVQAPMMVYQGASGGPTVGKVLILGGGDGLAAREVLKHPGVAEVVLVDLDPAVLELGARHPAVAALNDNAFRDPRLKPVAADAMGYLAERRGLFDVIIADLPDPDAAALGRLYTREFYSLVGANLAPRGIFVTQATSPFYAPEAFWGIYHTVGAAFEFTVPYHVLVPSFGDWGFVMAAPQALAPRMAQAPEVQVATRFFDRATFEELRSFPKDMAPLAVAVSTLDHPRVVDAYRRGWRQW